MKGRVAVVLLALIFSSCATWRNFPCPYCTQPTYAKEPGETFCRNCNRNVVWAVCPACGAEEALPGPGAWRCSACGVQAHASTCRICSTATFARAPGAPCVGCATPAPEAAALKRKGRGHAERGEWEAAAEAYDASLRLEPKDAAARYALACALARAGRRGPAMDALVRAVDDGYANWDLIRKDPDLASLRADPRWEALLERAPE